MHSSSSLASSKAHICVTIRMMSNVDGVGEEEWAVADQKLPLFSDAKA